MGLSIKTIHGKEFLYFQYGKKSILIGPKGEYEKGNLDNVKISIKESDKRIDESLSKYVKDTIELSFYLPEPERNEYLSKRTAELLARLRRLKPAIQVQAQDLRQKVKQQIDAMIAKNKDIKEIAKSLGITEKQVSEYLNRR